MHTSPSCFRLFFIIGLMLLPLIGWAQTTRYVSTTGTNSNPASATSWATSTTNLQGAINASASGQRVFVARGLYKPGGIANTDRTISFSMKNGVAIYGGFVGNEGEPDQRPAVNPIIGPPTGTTLSGEIGNPNSTADNSLHVIYNVTGLTNSAVLDGFVITGGNANIEDEILNFAGGGVYNNGGFNNDNELSGNNCSPTFRNCLFQANSGLAGGAMLNDGQDGTSSPIIINCLFRANTTTRTGGAIVNDGSTDGISNPVLTNCVFQNNTAGLIGGAMFNTAEFSGTSNPVLTNCSFIGNTSGDSGGAMFNEGKSGVSNPRLTNCAFLSNGATLFGGALYNSGVDAGNSNPVLINCSFLANTANEGGALYNDGSAAANGVSGTSNVQVANSIFWNNGGGANTFVNNNASLTATYSLFQPSVTGYGTSPTNLTATTSPFVSTTSVSLVIGSAAINAGNPASVTVANPPYSATALPTTDLAGNPRILGGRVDMGPVEYPGPFTLSLLTAATPNPVCRGNTVALSVTASGGNRPYSYTWTAPAGFTLSGTSTSAVSGTVGNAVSGVQTFTVRVADASPTPNISSSVVSLTVNIPPTPTLTAGPSSTLTCQQTSLTLTASGGGPYTFSGPGVVSQNATSGTAVVNQAGTYSVVVTGANGCTARSTLVISQSLAPVTRLYVAASQTALNGGDGLSWATAFKDLQRALNYPCSQNLTEIWVAAGTYKPTSNTADRSASFAMKNNLAIIGGFVGNEQNLSERPAIPLVNSSGGASQPSSSTLSGDIGTVGDAGDNSYHVISNPGGLDNTAVLDGFVITGGFANGGSGSKADRGGAVLNNNGGSGQVCSPTFRNCSFQANYAFYAGGVMYNNGQGTNGNSSPVLTNCLFLANTASSRGGAIYNDGYLGTSSPILTNCAFQGNVAGSVGGAMGNGGSQGTSSPILTNCLFRANSSNISGAIDNNGYAGNCNPVLTNCAFVSNSATGNGGAMYNSGGDGGNCNPVFINCSFQGNRSAPGQVMANDGSSGTCRVQLTNSVFWDNGGANTFFNFFGATITATYTLFQSSVTGYSGSNNLTNASISPFTSTTSAALALNSAAIDAGNPASITVASPPYSGTALPTTDLAGNPRIVGVVLATQRVDMGAVEYSGPFLLTLLTSARPNVLCETRTMALSVTVSGGMPPYNYTWTAPAGITLSATSTSAISATVDNALTGPQTLTITVTDTAPTTSVSSSVVSFTVGTPPTPTLTAGPSETLTCNQTSLTLTATVGAGLPGSSYVFSGPGIVSQNAASGTAVINQPGTYTVTVTGTSSCTARTTLVISQSLVQVTRLYVAASQTATNGGDGLTWATAFKDLQHALTYPCSQSLTEIWVAVGSYKPSPGNRSASFTLRNGLAIIGGFAGTETSVSQRLIINPVGGQPSGSILSGDLLGNDGLNFQNNGDNSYHVINNPQGLNNSAVLDGFVITGGNANGNSPDNRGGGVYNNGSGAGQVCNPSFRNCLFQANSANSFGGAIYNTGIPSGQSNPVLTNCALLSNRAGFNGGALYNDGNSSQSSPVLTNCVLQSNSANSFGGAMYNNAVAGRSSPVLINCSLLGNSASNGGAMYNVVSSNGTASPMLINSVFWNNGGASLPGNSFANSNATGASATYSLFDSPAGVNISGPGNLTTTTSPFVSATSVALNVCSPAINAGNPASVTVANGPYSATALPATDLAGNPRIFGVGPANRRVDMGAVEFQAPSGSFTATLTAGPSGTLTCAQTSLTLTATVGAIPGTSFTFSGPGLSQSGSSSTAVASQEGVYSVTVVNASGCSSVGSTTVSSSTAPPAPPTLSASASVVCVGTNVLVVANVSGIPATFQWHRNGSPVSGQTSATLALGGVQLEQAGQYALVLSGGCNVTSAPFSLTVNPLPTVTLSFPAGSTVIGPGTGVATITLPAPLTDVAMQVFGGVQYERMIVIDRINGFEIRQVDSNASGIFNVTRTGPFRLTVTDGNDCQRTEEGVITVR